MDWQYPNLPAGVRIIDSGKKGPTVGIQACTHGDEKAGLAALQFLEETFADNPQRLLHGSLILIVGNIEAMKQGKRGISADMNRSFRTDADFLANADVNSNEFMRSRELMPVLEQCDYHLDIHSTSTPSETFSITLEPDAKHRHLCEHMPTSFASEGWQLVIVGAVMHYVEMHGGTGLTVECGAHTNPEGAAVAVQATQQFLQMLGCFDWQLPLSRVSRRLVVIHGEHIADPRTFAYHQSFYNFQPVASRQWLATDSLRKYEVPDREDLVIVFPASQESIQSGIMGDAYFLGYFESIF
jgi:succinylglutamate desuccinylase